MAAPFNDSFDGVSFSILKRDRGERREGRVSVRVMLDGTVYVDKAGRMPATRSYLLHLPSYAVFNTLLNTKTGETGTFVDSLRGTSTAILHNVEFEDDGADGSVTARAEFTIL